jgi:hypothetical protein
MDIVDWFVDGSNSTRLDVEKRISDPVLYAFFLQRRLEGTLDIIIERNLFLEHTGQKKFGLNKTKTDFDFKSISFIFTVNIVFSKEVFSSINLSFETTLYFTNIVRF